MGPLKRSLTVVALVGGCLLLGSGVSGAGQAGGKPQAASHDSKSLDRLPPAVQKTAREQSAGAVIHSVGKEVEKGKTVYELEMTVNGRSKDVLIAADGTLMVVETEVTLESLSAAVRETLLENSRKAKIVRIESVALAGTFAYYEAQLKTGSKLSELKINAGGHLVLDAK